MVRPWTPINYWNLPKPKLVAHCRAYSDAIHQLSKDNQDHLRVIDYLKKELRAKVFRITALETVLKHHGIFPSK